MDDDQYLAAYLSTMKKVNHATAKTSVWWDIKMCKPPAGCDPLLIGPNIRSWLARMGYRGDVTIYAYGDTKKIPNSFQQALNSTGITLEHIGDGYKKRVLAISADLMVWANANRRNRTSGNCLLISSGHCCPLSTLDLLRFDGNHIILEYPPNGPQAERECLLRGILGGELQSCLGASGNQKRGQGSSSSAPSSVNQKFAGKVGRPSIGSAPLGNQKVVGKVGQPSIGGAPSLRNQKVVGKVGQSSINSAPSGNQKVAGKVGRPSISSAPSTENQKVAGKVGRLSISSAPSTGNQKVAGKVGRPSISSAPFTGNQKVADKAGTIDGRLSTSPQWHP